MGISAWFSRPHPDYRHAAALAVTIFLIIITIPFEVIIAPFAREFRLDNHSISYPYVENELVSAPLLLVFAFIIPACIIGYPLLAESTRRKHISLILGLLLSLATTIAVVDVAKIAIGNQRPDFIERCKPRAGTSETTYNKVLDVCTNPNMGMVWEGCKSTPSGHSALSFAGLGFLAIYLEFLIRESMPLKFKLLRWIPALPILLAAFVALSRIVDHKHHWLDIIAGGSLGLAFACFSYWYVVLETERARIAHAV